MDTVIVVGSGASGVHLALTLLRKGYEVTMLDVGFRRPSKIEPGLDFRALKRELPDAAEYFLGRQLEGVLLPGPKTDLYRIPPSKSYVLKQPIGVESRERGFASLRSFAQGGLGEAWTAGCYPFSDQDLTEFPFGYDSLAPYYSEVAARIGVSGCADDLERFLPIHDGLLPPLDLDVHSRMLMAVYARRRHRLNAQGCYLGRTRVATLTRTMGDRQPCTYLGRCLWGCPVDALYTPSMTLADCLRYPRFRYLDGLLVTHFEFDGRRITRLVAKTLNDSATRQFTADRVVLSAGTLSTAQILLRSVHRRTGERVRLPGLMDNRQVYVPFLNPRLLGKRFESRGYQYHLLGIGLETSDPRDYVHCQVTTLTTALAHPIVQRIPLDLATARRFLQQIRGALGIVNINLRDTRRKENYVELADSGGPDPILEINYSPEAEEEEERVRGAVSRIKRALRTLGCIAPSRMLEIREMGSGVHYSGTLPMCDGGGPWTTNQYGGSRRFENLHVVDGSTFPRLPAKNITFTLMANAIRVAEEGF